MVAEAEDAIPSVSGICNFDISDFVDKTIIGSGSEGTVYKAKHKQLKKWMAYKEFNRLSYDSIVTHREIDNLMKCKAHENIVSFHGRLYNDSVDCIGYVMQYYEDGSLHHVLHKTSFAYETSQIFCWIHQIALGLQYLHSEFIIHRDIKPRNILVANKGARLKLADFGLSRLLSKINSSYVGTTIYMAPEVVQGKSYSFPVDIYSFAITMWEIFHRLKPQRAVNPEEPLSINPQLVDETTSALIKRCWLSESKRPDIGEIISHAKSKLDEKRLRPSQIPQVTTEVKAVVGLEAKEEDRTLTGGNKEIPPSVRAELDSLRDAMKQLPEQFGKKMESLEASINNRFWQLTSRIVHLEAAINNLASFISSLAFPAASEINTILSMGGGENNNELCVLNKDRSKWQELQLKLPHKLAGGGAAYLNQEIYLFGGSFPNQEQDDPKSLRKLFNDRGWIRLANMNAGRTAITHSSVVCNGAIWVLGGYDNSCKKRLNSVEKYNPREDTWTRMKNMSCPRSEAAAAVWNGKIVVCGGYGNDGWLRSVECYNPLTNEWTTWPEMPIAVAGHILVVFKDQLYVMGGHQEQNTSICTTLVMNFDKTWSKVSQMSQRRFEFCAMALDEEIFALGGIDKEQKEIADVQIYKGSSWQKGPSLPFPKCGRSALIISLDLADKLSSCTNSNNTL